MKYIIIADIHDNLKNLSKCLDWCKRETVDGMICCGDLTNSETLKYLTQNFSRPIYLVKGNIEIYKENEINSYPQINYLGKFGCFDLAGKKIGFCHEPALVNKILEQEACQIIFYGHTHQPWVEKRGAVIVANPGTLGGVFYQASFATYDLVTDKLELKILSSL